MPKQSVLLRYLWKDKHSRKSSFIFLFRIPLSSLEHLNDMTHLLHVTLAMVFPPLIAIQYHHSWKENDLLSELIYWRKPYHEWKRKMQIVDGAKRAIMNLRFIFKPDMIHFRLRNDGRLFIGLLMWIRKRNVD